MTGLHTYREVGQFWKRGGARVDAWLCSMVLEKKKAMLGLENWKKCSNILNTVKPL